MSSTDDGVEAMGVLIEAGANVEARGRHGRTPLHAAANERSQGAVLALLKHGAEVNAKKNGQNTPLHDAAFHAGRRGTAEVVDVLLRRGADETIANADGQTPADIARGRFEDRGGLEEDFERVRMLLANAPADRAWRRRGYLAMCRAHPSRLRRPETNLPEAGRGGPRFSDRAKLVTAGMSSSSGGGGGEGGAGDDTSTCASWAAVVTRVLGLEEEGLFRAIVEYL